MLITQIPDKVDDSWYKGVPCIMLKLTAISPSTSIRNAAEIANSLVFHYGGKDRIPPVLVMYTDGGPEHRSTFLSVKIALIALQRWLNLDMII